MRPIRLLLPALLIVAPLRAQTGGPAQSNAMFAAATPFGLRPGIPEAEARKLMQLQPAGLAGVYMTTAVPRGWPALVAYVMDFSPRRGMCKLAAVTAASGDQGWLKQTFALLSMNLAAIYGNPKEFFGYEAGATLTEPKDWGKAIVAKQLVHSTAWLRDDGAKLPPGIDGIILDIQGQQENKLIVAVTFYFGSEKLCEQERVTTP